MRKYIKSSSPFEWSNSKWIKYVDDRQLFVKECEKRGITDIKNLDEFCNLINEFGFVCGDSEGHWFISPNHIDSSEGYEFTTGEKIQPTGEDYANWVDFANEHGVTDLDYFGNLVFGEYNYKNPKSNIPLDTLNWCLKKYERIKRYNNEEPFTINSSRRISSSQKGFENVAEGTKYDDYHIDTKGMGILSVENIIEEIEGRGNQAVLTVQTSDGSTNHSQFSSKDWKEYKDSVNNSGNAITDVWVTEVEGGSYVRNSRRPIKSSVNDELYKYLSKKTDCTKTDDYIEFPDDGRVSDKYLDKFVDKYNVSLDYKRTGDTMIVYLPQSRQIKSARRPIKSSKEYFEMDSYITGRDHMTDFLGFTCDVTKNGDKFEWSNVQSWFSNEDFVDPESRIYGVYDNQEQFLDDVIYFLDSEQGQDVMQEEYEKKKKEGYVWDERGYQVSDDYFYSDPAVELDNWSEDEYLNSSRRPVKSGFVVKRNDTGEYLGWMGMNTEWMRGEENAIMYDSKEYIERHQGELGLTAGLPDGFTIIEVNSSRKITSARYIATDPESGEVLGSADTYEEAVNEWGEDVTITDSEAAEGQEDMELFQSRKITSAVDGGWEVRSSDVPEALDLFVEYFGEEDALEEIAKAMGDNVLQENIEWIAQQWGFGEEIEDLDVWEQYETAKEYMGVSELFNNLTQAAGYDELAADLAFIFRMNDFHEWDKYDNEDEEDEEWEDDEEIESSLQNSFPVKTVKNIMSGKWSEDYATECIAQKQDINVGYAKQILSSWIEQYKPKLIKSGILDIAEDINAEFDIDGDLESWAEQYTNREGKSNTVGGEIVRAAMQIIYRYNNDGDMIGRGYGNETVNAAARYLIEKIDMPVNEQIQKWLDHEERASDSEYDSFIESLQVEVEDALRTNSSLFQKPNKDDYWNWKEDEDMNYGLDECYLDDGSGNQYWFQLNNDRWTCTGIELDPYSVTYTEGDRIDEGDEYSDEIDHTEEFGSFEADGFIYEYAGDDWDDDLEEYTSWQITKVTPQDPYCDEGDTFDFYDLEPDELSGFRLFDHNGNEVDERTFLASSLKIK